MNLLEKAKLEAEELKRQRDAVAAVFDAKIAVVEQTVKLLEPVYAPMSNLTVPLLDDSVGITEAIETALRKYAGKPLAPTAVRDVLSEMKFKINGDNPMASVHQVLKRLIARSSSPYISEQVDGQTMYKFDPAKESVKTRRTITIADVGRYDPFNLTKMVGEDQTAFARQLAEQAKANERMFAAVTSIGLPDNLMTAASKMPVDETSIAGIHRALLDAGKKGK
jgi:hypothetical protein